jgi:Lrp/AsnC family transcriptional regulator, leucine-responsive regulatory protein
MIDPVDLKILDSLQQDARMANVELARQVKMAPSAVLERVRKLEERGLIQGYEARLNAKTLGLGLVAFVFVRTDERAGSDATSKALAAIPEIQEIHDVAGEDCFLVKVRALDTEALGRVLRDRIGAIPTIRSTRTTIVLQTLKEIATIPLPGFEKEPGDA